MSLAPETVRRLDARVAATQATGEVPTLVAAIVRDGRLVHASAAGERLEPLLRTRYRIGSITKTMTAVLVMQERDAGRLRLDDPIERYLPGTPVGPVTVRQLLGHASGLVREPAGQWWERASGGDLDSLLAGLTAEQLTHPPHRVYHYSNLAYGLLGGLLERLTGHSWWQLTQDRLLTPLGMTDTTYQATEPFARGYVVHPWHRTLREEPRTDTGAMAPAGQLWSSLTDLGRWAAFLADPSGVPVGSDATSDPAGPLLAPETLAEMCVPVVISDLESWTSGHGLGLELNRCGERIFVGHGGSMPGYVAALAVHRASRTAALAFANAYGFRTGSIAALNQQLLTDVLDAEPAPVTPWVPARGAPPPDVPELCGTWWWMGRAYQAEWDPATGELVVRQPAAPGGVAPWRFTRTGADRWRGRTGMNDGELLAVRRAPDGTVEALDIATFVFTRDPDRLE